MLQLSQVKLAVKASAPGPDKDNLVSLEADIQELISLTKENLLSLEKQQTPASSSSGHCSKKQKVDESDPFAEEYALFKAELERTEISNDSTSQDAYSSKSNQTLNLADIQSELEALQGSKCQAPHSNQYGDMCYHNALVYCIEPSDDITSMDQIQLRVMFTNPTQPDMLPCPYYLEGECRFSQEKCRYSHGELVFFSSLKEYRCSNLSERERQTDKEIVPHAQGYETSEIDGEVEEGGEPKLISGDKASQEPDFSVVRPGLRVLVKQPDKLWHSAVILNLDSRGTSCEVKLEASGIKVEVQLHDILPLALSSASLKPILWNGGREGERHVMASKPTKVSFRANKNRWITETVDGASYRTDSEAAVSLDSSSDSSEGEGDEEEISVDPLVVHQTLLRTPLSTALGSWEKHTKGIGSLLMARMGYVTGSGLGRYSDGRVEPVDAVVLPAGKSLDHCMNLKEQAGGDENLFKVEKRLKRLQQKHEKQQEKQFEKEKNRVGVFDFLNNTLGGTEGSPETSNNKQENKGLKSESSRGLNMVSFRVGEEIRRTEREMVKLQESLARHDEGSQTHTKLTSKLTDKQNELQQLQASERSIDKERNQRMDRKKLSVF
ncbi:unnamed protein product [Timema podura]|uniref:Zinc finger CCCH-type with G patch domain-containing protein n=1 Tax=Timema podura TaxID=61482 RepID=A0ABN7NVG9_TIMPD|nr:unnamed protein product [Timema podura]